MNKKEEKEALSKGWIVRPDDIINPESEHYVMEGCHTANITYDERSRVKDE